MGYSIGQLTFLSFVLLIHVSSYAKLTSKPNPEAFVLPVYKDPSTLQYLTQLSMGTPLLPRTLVVDLSSRYVWLNCVSGFNSSTCRTGVCGSALCSSALSPSCGICASWTPKFGCTNTSCDLAPENPATGYAEFGPLSVDFICVVSTDGSASGHSISISNFVFACATHTPLISLAKAARGMLGLGHHPASLPFQLSSSYPGGSIRPRFAVCLPSKAKTRGAIFLGNSKFVFYPGYNVSKRIDITSRLTYTKLYVNPVSFAVVTKNGEKSAEYFVGLSSISVDGKPIKLNSTLLKFDKWGHGGTKISTLSPYTVLHSSIYKALVTAFDTEMISSWNSSKVPAVAPFKDCYTVGKLAYSLLGFSVPDISFVFENMNVKWDVFGVNSMVEINKDVICLGFLDGGVEPRTSVLIGAHQQQDNLLVFDPAQSKMGFSSSLFLVESECSNFNLN